MIVIPISLVAVAFSTLVQVNRLFKNKILLRRVLAALFLISPGLLPGLVTGNYFSLLTRLQMTWGSSMIAVGFSVLAILINFYHASDKNNIKVYPHIRQSRWTPGLFILNAVSMTVYLAAYEWLFRGYLLFGCLETYPMWFAILINIIVYAGAHLHQGPRETVLSIPFGILLCLISWVTGSFIAATIIHVAVALSNDFFSIRANPEMEFSFITAKKLSV